jgi:uncharacterized membrane protein YhaH (DUF805 family)
MDKTYQILINGFTRKYFSFSGRANRTEYWILTTFVTALNFIPEFNHFVLGNALQSYHVLELFYSLVSILLIIPSISVVVRRLHDINLSGYWSLIIVLMGVSITKFHYLISAIILVIFITLMCKKKCLLNVF